MKSHLTEVTLFLLMGAVLSKDWISYHSLYQLALAEHHSNRFWGPGIYKCVYIHSQPLKSSVHTQYARCGIKHMVTPLYRVWVSGHLHNLHCAGLSVCFQGCIVDKWTHGSLNTLHPATSPTVAELYPKEDSASPSTSDFQSLQGYRYSSQHVASSFVENPGQIRGMHNTDV